MPRTRTPLVLSSLAACALVLTAGGCYERVVSAQGFGADQVSIYSADSPDPVRSTKLRQSTTHKELTNRRMRVQER